MSKWLRFQERKRRGLFVLPARRYFGVISKSTGAQLGEIYWWSSWSQYIFEPERGCIFSHERLSDIAKFCADQTEQIELELD